MKLHWNADCRHNYIEVLKLNIPVHFTSKVLVYIVHGLRILSKYLNSDKHSTSTNC